MQQFQLQQQSRSISQASSPLNVSSPYITASSPQPLATSVTSTSSSFNNGAKSQSSRNGSTSSHSSHGSPASPYPPTMNQMVSPAPSIDSPLDVLDRMLEIRLPVPNSGVANEITKQQQQQQQDDDDDTCGVCVKEDCICESLGIRPPRNTTITDSSNSSLSKDQDTTSSFTTLPPIQGLSTPLTVGPSVPLKRRRDTSNNTTKSLLPVFKRAKPNNNDNNNNTNTNDSLEMDFTTAFAKPKPISSIMLSSNPTGSNSSNTQNNDGWKNSNNRSRKNSSTSDNNTLNTDAVSSYLMGGTSNPGTPLDRCGFCSDGTPCLCADTAAQEASSLADIVQDNPLPPISFNDNTSKPSSRSNSRHNSSTTVDSLKLPSLMGASNPPVDQQGGCTGNPGTCLQCQADPMSTLFCTTLASRVSSSRTSLTRELPSPTAGPGTRHNSVTDTNKSAASSGGCCGGSSSGGGCCKSKKTDQKSASSPTTSVSPKSTSSTTNTNSSSNGSSENSGKEQLPGVGTFIPCSAAYQTLSRHKDFRRADLGKLVGKLNTRGMQVEVSSVANVLRELDRRLYND